MHSDDPTLVVTGGASAPQPPTDIPARIGPYRILRVLGQGGMGIVYEAEQQVPLRRTVALKVIRQGMDTHEVLARFEHERQALAVMDHPNIARALDAGTTEDGLPYFVMELVDGAPITEYCDAERLDVRARLELFLGVCKGVQHAHQKGVIHRDLKPRNILVRVSDLGPVATIIDFGVAKAVERPLITGAYATQLGALIGTPQYMSPEQAEASGLDIDTRSDIYSLGMVLYELIAGVLPFDPGSHKPGAYIAEYVLGDTEAPTPSRRIAGLTEADATPVADHRHTTPVGLRRELHGDLDWIVLKAIHRDRAQRYETATGLANDIERHLAHKPVSARAPTLGYRASRFVRRHRLAVAVAGIAAAALIVTTAGIARERNRAERERARAEAISGFLQDVLASADPWQGGERQTTVVEALKAGEARVSAPGFADTSVTASIKRSIGMVYLNLGRLAEAEPLLHAALEARLARGGPPDADVAQSWADLGNLYYQQGKLDSAGPAMQRGLELRRELLGAGDTLVAASLLDLADLAHELGERRHADTLAQEALGILRAAHGPRHPSVAQAMSRIIGAELNYGNYGRVDSMARVAIAMMRDLGYGRSPKITGILNDLSLSRMYQKDYAEATALMKEVIAIDSAMYGPSHPELATHLENLGLIYSYQGFNDSTIAMLHQTLAMRRAVLPKDSPDIGRTLFNMGVAQYNMGNYRASEPLFEDAIARFRVYGPEHTDVVWATATLGRTQYRVGRLAEAEKNLRRALGVTDPDGRLAPSGYARFGSALTSLYVGQRRWAEAEPIALRVLAIRDSLGDTAAARAAADTLAVLYEGWGKTERAAQYRER